MSIETIGLSVDPRPSEAGLARIRNSLSLTDRAGKTTQGVLSGLGTATQKGASLAVRSIGGIGSALTSLKGLIAGVGLATLTKSVINTADSYQLLQSRLRLVTTGAENLKRVQEELFQVAQRTRQPIEETTELYLGLARSQKELGASQAELVRFTEGVGASLVLSGKQGQAAAGALLQLSQAMGGAVIQAQEFNSLIDGAPALLQAVAKNLDGTGGSIAGLTRLVKDGQVTNTEFFQAALKGSDQLIDALSRTPRTVGQAFQQLKNEFTQGLGQADTSPLVQAIDDLREKIKDPEFQRSIVTTAEGLIGLAAAAANFFNAIAKQKGAVQQFATDEMFRRRSAELHDLNEELRVLQKLSGSGSSDLNPFNPSVEDRAKAIKDRVAELRAELDKVAKPVTITFDVKTMGLASGLPGIGANDSTLIPFRRPDQMPQTPAGDAAFFAKSPPIPVPGGGDTKAKVTEAQRLIDSLKEELALYGELTKAEEVRISLANGFYGKVTAAQATQIQALADEITARDQLKASIEEEIAAEAKLLEQQEKLREEGKQVWQATRTPLEAYNLEIDRLSELLRQGAIDLDTFARASVQASEDLSSMAEKTKDATDEMKVFADQAARNIQDAFADFLFDPFDKGLKGMLLSFEETLRRMVANQAAAQILGSFGGAAGGGLLGSILGFAGSIFGGGGPGAAVPGDIAGAGPGGLGVGTLGGGRAIGGPVYPGMAYSVGELGREKFIPSVRGRIEAANDQGPTNITINVPISAPDGTVTPKTRQQIATDIGREVRRNMARFT